MKNLLPLLGLSAVASAQCPDTPSPNFSCTSSNGQTHITLFQNAELRWDRFDVPAGGSLDITSNGGPFSSKHLTSGFFPSTINGPINADGPFTLINSAGIRFDSAGSLTAPSLTLSTLPSFNGTDYLGHTRSGQMVIKGDLHATSGDATLLGYQTTLSGSLTAPSGKVTLIASGSEIIDGATLQRSPGPTPARIPARVTNQRGQIQAPVVEIYSEGFIQNSGGIAGRRVILQARSISHDDRPGSLIITPDLTLIPNTLLDGTISNPTEGNYPGGISTTLALPDLTSKSFTGTKKTTLLPTQFSTSNLSRSRVRSAVSKKSSHSSSSRLATRGTPPAKLRNSSRKAKKSSFFGIVTTKK